MAEREEDHRVCAKCGSKRLLLLTFPLPTDRPDARPRFKCVDCGWRGPPDHWDLAE